MNWRLFTGMTLSALCVTAGISLLACLDYEKGQVLAFYVIWSTLNFSIVIGALIVAAIWWGLSGREDA